MKKIVFLFLLMSVTLINAQKHIVVAIAVGKTSCNYTTNTDLGYQIYTGDSKFNAEKLASEKVKKDHPKAYKIAVLHNGWNAKGGSFIVILASKTKYQGCDKYTYGVGFGFNKSDALRNAKKSLGMRDGNWSESSHGYSEVYSNSY